ncbi:hypothetical protein MMC28_003066 [Mycoblastus sanguinarius]|nr:hypothetical protein [Mycoblastus sanguinarius]
MSFSFNGIKFGKQVCQLVVALAVYQTDESQNWLSEGTIGQVVLWKYGRQGSWPGKGLIDRLTTEKDATVKEWLTEVDKDDEKWAAEAKEAWEEWNGQVGMKPRVKRRFGADGIVVDGSEAGGDKEKGSSDGWVLFGEGTSE